MKKLISAGVEAIYSGRPRTFLGIDKRGIRICVKSLGRSCSLNMGYITFNDGSAYEYSAGSKADIEALCASLHRGKDFNFSTRRVGSGYVRGFTPPADYQQIYSYPPYPGVKPSPCPNTTVDWNSVVWSNYTTLVRGGGFADGTFVGGHVFVEANGGTSPFCAVGANGTVGYTGAVSNQKVTVTVASTGGNFIGFIVTQNSSARLTISSPQLPSAGTYVFNYTLLALTGSVISLVGIVSASPARWWAYGSGSFTQKYTAVFENA